MQIEFVDGPLRGRRAPAAAVTGNGPKFLIAHLVRDLPGLRSVDEYEVVDGLAEPRARWLRFVRYESASAPGTVFTLELDPPGFSRGDGKRLRA
jgi:hypothetical protein